MTHIAGLAITMQGQYIRQRCAWCGEILQDVDLSKIATVDGELPGSWTCGTLIYFEGNMASMVPGDKLPEDCCYSLERDRP